MFDNIANIQWSPPLTSRRVRAYSINILHSFSSDCEVHNIIKHTKMFMECFKRVPV